MSPQARKAALAAAAGGIAGLAGAYLLNRRHARPRVPEPAKPVDLARYLGRWYELARYENWFEHGCADVTADYAPLPGGLIQVINTCRKDDGRIRQARGRAKVRPGTGNTKLKVSFFGPLYVGDYWVMDHADNYGWSIVGEPSGKFLWLLGREPAPGRRAINNLIARAAELGYEPGRIARTRQSRR